MIGTWIRKFNRTSLDHYVILKRTLGILGMVLPFVCILGGAIFAGTEVQNSVSHYYHTNMRDVLVGLGAVSLFLVTYQGYGPFDNLISTLTGIAGAGVVVFPCPTYPASTGLVGILQLPQDVSGNIHLYCAGAFFLLLAFNSAVLFTITDQGKWTGKKLVRNIIYIMCGCIMFACIVVLFIISRASPDFFSNSRVGLVFEAIMLFFFGVSWLVKSGVPFLSDKKQKP
jgi:uncharacterized membrane protein SirB2